MSDTKIPRGRRVRPPAESKPEPPPEPSSAQSRKKAEAEIGRFLESMSNLSTTKLSHLLTFARILDRDRGDDTPVESFINTLVLFYQQWDDNGKGLPLGLIASEFENLRDNLDEHVRRAHFIASRYPLPAEGSKEA